VIRFSIQIPTYNQSGFIREAVQSAFNQNYENKQIIVADDCSNFDVANCLNDFIGIELIQNKPNKGRVKNYHDTLYNYVKGDYFINLDGDDYLVNNHYLEYVNSIISKHDNIAVFEGQHNIERIKKIVKVYEEIDDKSIKIDGKLYFSHISKISEFSHGSCCFNTAIAKQVGFYTEDCFSTDFNSFCKILMYGSIIVSDISTIHWRKHKMNTTWSLSVVDFKREFYSNYSIYNYSQEFIGKQNASSIIFKLNEGLYNKVLSNYSDRKFMHKLLKLFQFSLFSYKSFCFYFYFIFNKLWKKVI
jgi:glycosyltransferase involved in cell wall biosynthesis